jgi:perosamine synthetase
MRKNIFTAASPNTQGDDAWLAFRLLVQPWKWFNHKYNDQFKKELINYLEIGHVSLVDSGRTGINIALKALDIKEGDEVILPSFTCVVVANATRWTGAKPVYLDTNDSDFNADYSTLPNFINNNTKAILVQHTFGKIVDVDSIKNSLKKLNREDIILIEDFAHTIYQKLPLKGDVGVLTFGIEKIISSVRGGAIITNNLELHDKFEKEVETLPEFPRKQVIKSLLNPIFWYFAIPLHSVGLGRFTIGASIRTVWRKLGFLGIMVEPIENLALRPKWFPAKMNPALSKLGMNQLQKLDKFNEHRTEISKIYHEKLSQYSDEKEFDENRIYIRYPLVFKSEEEFLKVWNKARSLGVTLGNWFSTPLYGAGTNKKTYERLCYVPATTPKTLQKTGLTINLPTSVNMNSRRARELAEEISKLKLRIKDEAHTPNLSPVCRQAGNQKS